MVKFNEAYLTPEEAHRLSYVRAKLRNTASGFQHDRLVDAISEIVETCRRRMQDAASNREPETTR